MDGLNVVDIPVDAIVPIANVRSGIDDDADGELSDSVAELGVLQPVRVRQHGSMYHLVVGHRRYAAAVLAGMATIPAILDDRPADPLRDAIEQVTENIQREALAPLDLAKALRLILDAERARFVEASRRSPGTGLRRTSPADLSRRLGKSAAFVGEMLRLLRLHPEVQGMVADGRITASHGRAISHKRPSEQVKLALAASRGAASANIVALRSSRVRFYELSGDDGSVRVSAVGRYGEVGIGDATVRLSVPQLRRLAGHIGAVATVVAMGEDA